MVTGQDRSERWTVQLEPHLTIWREGAFQQLSALDAAFLAVSVRRLARDHADHLVISYFPFILLLLIYQAFKSLLFFFQNTRFCLPSLFFFPLTQGN